MYLHSLLEGLAEVLHGMAAIIAAVLIPSAAVKASKALGASWAAEGRRKDGDGR